MRLSHLFQMTNYSANAEVFLAQSLSVTRFLVERTEPTKEQEKRLRQLVANYQFAIKLVNIEMTKGTLGDFADGQLCNARQPDYKVIDDF